MLRKWLKRLTALLVVVLAAISAASYVLYFRRTPLPPAAPHARVAPVIPAISGLAACWVETASTFSDFPFGATAGSILVRHPAGGLMDLPKLPVLLSREELQFAADPRVQAKGYVIPAHTLKFPPADNPTLRFVPQPYETFDESADLYGDGSVVVVPLRGHTPGSVGIFVNLSPAQRLFYVGDSVDDERGFKQRVGKSLILRDSDNDAPRANQIVARLTDLHEKLPVLAIIPAHGRSAYKKFFPSGPLSCVSAQAPR